MATNNLLMQIQINQLLTNDDAELGMTSISEDIGKLFQLIWLITYSIDAEDDDG